MRIWDVTNPTQPKVLWRHLGMTDTHKNYWECEAGGIAYLVSRPKGWRAAYHRGLRPQRSVQPGKDPRLRPARTTARRDRCRPGDRPRHGLDRCERQPHLHGLRHQSRRASSRFLDREKLLKGPKEPTPENLHYPEIARMDDDAAGGAHTAMPLGRIKIQEFAKDADKGDREFVMIVNETFREECGEARQMVWFVDSTIEKYPMVVSNWTVPEASGNFCARGGRFGAHSSNEDMGPPYYQKLTFITFFNAGVRVLDIRNPYQPKEVGLFHSADQQGDHAALW
jgi:hypothetical protein